MKTGVDLKINLSEMSIVFTRSSVEGTPGKHPIMVDPCLSGLCRLGLWRVPGAGIPGTISKLFMGMYFFADPLCKKHF